APDALPVPSSAGMLIPANTALLAISCAVKNLSSRSFCVRSCSQSVSPDSLSEVSSRILASRALSPLQAVVNTPAPVASRPKALRDSLLFMCMRRFLFYLTVQLFLFFQYVFRCPHRHCEDGPRQIFIALLHERPRINNIHVSAIVCLAPFIYYRLPKVITHTRGTSFVNNHARCFQSVLCLWSLFARQNDSTNLMHD